MPVAGIPMLPIPGTWSVVLGIAQCSFHYLYGSVLHFVVHCTVHQYGSYLFIEGALGIPGWFWRVLGSHRHSWGEQLLFTGMKRVYIHTVLVPMNNSWNLFGPHVTCCSRQQYVYKVTAHHRDKMFCNATFPCFGGNCFLIPTYLQMNILL